MKTIIIMYDRNTISPDLSPIRFSESHAHVEEFINNENLSGTIYTHDLTFFSFDYLDKCDVVILSDKGIIVMSDLMDITRCNYYTDKEMKKAHNILKMFLAGSFKWRKQ